MKKSFATLSISTRIMAVTLLLFSLAQASCKKEEAKPGPTCDDNTELQINDRQFHMGFTSWPYGPEPDHVDDTYAFIAANGDIHSEHLDHYIPWRALINNTPLPNDFTQLIAYKASKRRSNEQLLLAVSLLNLDRDDLLPDIDGFVPEHQLMSDKIIEDAYVAHLTYLIEAFNPSYLVLAIEVNELLINAPAKWNEYTALISKVRPRIKDLFPSLKMTESITLHNWFNPDLKLDKAIMDQIAAYIEQNGDFIAISFYPYFKGLHTSGDFQKAFDFLHAQTSKPIAFVETAHLAQNLDVETMNVHIKSSECEQKAYLETLLKNADDHRYEFVIWWCHRDYTQLWLTFPENVKDIGQIWLHTGLVEDDGTPRPAFDTWKSVLAK